jgi:uncharacterized protein YkwD
MKFRVFSFFVLSGALMLSFLISGGQAQSQSKSNQALAGPTGNSPLSLSERDVLNEINEVRAHPEKYVTYLEGLKPFFKDKEYRNGQMAVLTQEGWSAVDDAIKFLRAAKPQPPFNLSSGLCLAATSHVKSQSATGATGHKGTGDTMIEDRVKPFGSWADGIGESLSYGNESPRDRILTWLIDDGFATRGHRMRLLSPEYKVAGLSCGPHPEFGTMCVLTLAGAFTDIQAPAKASTSIKPIAASTSIKPATTTLTSSKPTTTKSTTPKKKKTTKSRSK